MAILRRYWAQYSSTNNVAASFIEAHKNAVKKMYNRHHKDGTTMLDLKRFWEYGTLDVSVSDATHTERPYFNPLFVYSDATGSNFSVHKDTSPLTGFHIVFSSCRQSPFFEDNRNNPELLNDAVGIAKDQFKSWCETFRRFIGNKDPKSKGKSLKIRFFIGDAIALCRGLNELRELYDVVNCYNRPGSVVPLKIDSVDYLPKSRDRAPIVFDVIDTAYLIDRVGLLNLFPSVVLGLRDTTSALYSSTCLRDEPTLLSKLLCGDVGVMCILLGVMPVPYACGLTTYACQQVRRENSSPITNRITWRLDRTGDSIVEFKNTTPVCDANNFWKYLLDLYHAMFPDNAIGSEIQNPRFVYTRSSYAALLAFFKRRISVNWSQCIVKLLDALKDEFQEKDNTDVSYAGDILMNLELYGLFSISQPPPQVKTSSRTQHIGILKRQNVPDPCVVVLTVPRHTIQTLKEKVVNYGKPCPMYFQLSVLKADGSDLIKLTSVHAVFGKVIPSANGETGTIEEDSKGWAGNSDMQLCSYFPTEVVREWEGFNNARVGVMLIPRKEALEVFKADYGENLVVFKTCLNHDNTIYFFSDLPGLKKRPMHRSDFLFRETATETQTYTLEYPRLDVDKPNFTTHIKFRGSSLELLRNGEKVDLHQLSACTITIRFGSVFIQCDFPFPVFSSAARVRVSRNKGWIDVIAPLITLTERGHFSVDPFPLIVTPPPNMDYYNLYLPHVNFDNLHKISLSSDSTAWIESHLMTMFTDREINQRENPSDLFIQVKNTMHKLLSPTTHILRINPTNGEGYPIVLFIGDKYIDINSHSIIAEAYMFPISSKTEVAIQSSLPAVEIAANESEVRFWKSAMKAYIERCREWRHLASCELISEAGSRTGICNCGKGKSIPDLPWINQWKETFSRQVTKLAISTLFTAPYMGQTLRASLATTVATTETSSHKEPIMDNAEGDIIRCKVCLEPAAKKCAKCQDVAYCSRACQAKDWKEHKKTCGIIN